ncbi:hypothetical protein VL12_08410 [Rossellomorea marisflavi]|nr:hypothetical protein VL12_08410 [Rossellomorea marisflavi]
MEEEVPDVDWKKYFILLPPFLIFTTLVFLFIPYHQLLFASLIIIFFWILYYIWVAVDKARKEKSE